MPKRYLVHNMPRVSLLPQKGVHYDSCYKKKLKSILSIFYRTTGSFCNSVYSPLLRCCGPLCYSDKSNATLRKSQELWVVYANFMIANFLRKSGTFASNDIKLRHPLFVSASADIETLKKKVLFPRNSYMVLCKDSAAL